jgi:hypothetical protein
VTSNHLAAQKAVPPSDADALPSLECREVLPSFWDCRDGRSTPGLAERVEAHLAACVPCYGLREFQQRFFASLAELRERSSAPARVHDRVRKALAAERRAGRSAAGGNSFSPRGLYL